jgi:DNA-binding PadR family transcriptional regulator
MAVREGLLLLLAEQPRHGYELKTLFEQRTGELWQLNTGQIYTTLERLERDGLVEPTGEVSDDARRRSYRLTEAGRHEAATWLGGPTAADTPRDELVMKVLLVTAGDDRAAALATIDAHRHELMARLQEVRQRQRAAPAGTLSARLVADALAVRAEADLRWLDLCVERLRHDDERNGGDGGDGGNGHRDGAAPATGTATSATSATSRNDNPEDRTRARGRRR